MTAPASKAGPAMKRAIAAVHACRKQVAGLDDDAAWRSFLEREAGKSSLRDMDGRELGRVLDALHKSGAPRRPGAGAGRPRLDDRPQVRKARALWIGLAQAGAVRDRSERAFESFVCRTAGRDAMRWCGASDLNRVIEALKDWQERVDRGAAGGPGGG